MQHPFTTLLVTFLSLILIQTPAFAKPVDFSQSKQDARRYIYFDRTDFGTLYCGCQWQWAGRSGGRVDLNSCGYQIRSQRNRAERIEWEHIVPASNFGRARQCWQNGGRKNCNKVDPVFNQMEADLHNLAPSVGEINGDRSNFNFGMLPSTPLQHGRCPFKVDFKGRTVEPRNEVKGRIARVYFYMFDRYNLPMSKQQQQLFMAWNAQYPVTAWERERDNRIAKQQGNHNPFVTGERQWTLGHKNSREGIAQPGAVTRSSVTSLPSPVAQKQNTAQTYHVRGNQRSHIYHLSKGCPGYSQISAKNRVEFRTEDAAIAAGYRKAGNCR